jgi:hypothetical protein
MKNISYDEALGGVSYGQVEMRGLRSREGVEESARVLHKGDARVRQEARDKLLLLLICCFSRGLNEKVFVAGNFKDTTR